MSFTKKVNISICKVLRLNPEMQNYSRNSKLEFVGAFLSFSFENTGMWIYFDHLKQINNVEINTLSSTHLLSTSFILSNLVGFLFFPYIFFDCHQYYVYYYRIVNKILYDFLQFFISYNWPQFQVMQIITVFVIHQINCTSCSTIIHNSGLIIIWNVLYSRPSTRWIITQLIKILKLLSY